MKSSARGTRISNAEVEVQGVLKESLWLLVRGREYVLPFTLYPWFKTANVSTLQHVKLLHGHHLYWPDLDVDVDLAALEHPERYPLKFR